MTLIAETRRDEHLQTALIDELLAEQINDFIFASVYPRPIALPPALQTANVVMANCAAQDFQAAAVLPDEVEAGRAAGYLLLERGYREGIYLVGDRATHPYAPGQDRERGLRTSLRAAGGDLAGALDCAWEPEDTYEALSHLMESSIQPRALICMNDRVALGAYQALAEHRLAIPTDVAVIAFETSQIGAWLRPSLTGIDRQLRRIGNRAVDRLLNGPPPLRGHELIPPQLRLRHSA